MVRVREIMHQHTFVPEDMTIREVASLMSKKKIGSVLIKAKKGLGILTERDILTKVVSLGADPHKLKAADIMTSHVRTIDADADIYEACSIFTDNSFRRLPVVEKGEIIGIVTTRDIARQFIPKLVKETYHFEDFRF